MRLFSAIPLLRIVPDDTKFDFMRFRRISFPASAILSIVAIVLFFHPGLNLGIDFVGGTLLEVQAKSGQADIAKMRASLTALNLANVHDLVLTLGFMSLMQVDFDLTSIAALLTILGYSLNDTVVIYDRIREMLRRYKKLPMTDLLNISINSTLSRSIITHLTVTLALLALFFFGGHAIHSFTATMIFGVVLVGTYTSIFIAAPILIYLGVGLTRVEARQSD